MSTKFNFNKAWHSLTADQKKKLAEEFGSSVPHLANVANGHKTPGERFMRMLEIVTTEFMATKESSAA